MTLIWGLQNRLKSSGFLMILVMMFFYFLFYTVNGERGMLKYLYLKKEIAKTQEIAGSFNKQKVELESKVRLLSSSSLDLDLLEERARVVLNYVGNDEFVILDSSAEN